MYGTKTRENRAIDAISYVYDTIRILSLTRRFRNGVIRSSRCGTGCSLLRNLVIFAPLTSRVPSLFQPVDDLSEIKAFFNETDRAARAPKETLRESRRQRPPSVDSRRLPVPLFTEEHVRRR